MRTNQVSRTKKRFFFLKKILNVVKKNRDREDKNEESENIDRATSDQRPSR